MINITNVHKSFGSLRILDGIDLEVQKSKVVSLIGPSGSGKSTLLMCVNGLEEIQKGTIFVDDMDVSNKRMRNKLRRNIGMVFQQYNAFPHLTVLENTELAPRIVLKLTKKEARERAASFLEQLGLGEKLSLMPSKLSGGQQQRLAIARALAMNPSYMLFDEITSALDPELVGEVLDALRLLREQGMTMLIVTHEIPFAREVSDEVAFFDKGVIVEKGPPREVLDSPKSERLRGFLSKIL